MDIAITGSSGMIGAALSASLRADGHQVIAVTRGAGTDDSISWDPEAGTIDAEAFNGLDAVVHLAGQPIAAGPWTAKQRQRIHQSRAAGTTLLAETLAGLDNAPATLVSGSAIGYYGDRGDEVLTEDAGVGSGFLPTVCTDWEDGTAAASAAGIRVAIVRTGIVLDADEGALAKQLPLFKVGLGGKAGDGAQWLAWITLDDHIRAVRFAIDTPQLVGPVNLTAPAPVTNATFTETLGEVLGRPTFLRIPRLARHAPFGIGELVDSLLFTSARVEPKALLDAGFTFEHPELRMAIEAVLAA